MLPKNSNNPTSTSTLVHFPVYKLSWLLDGVLSHITCLLLLNWLVLFPILQRIYIDSWNIGLSTGNWNPPFSGPVRVSGIEFHRLSINCNKRSLRARCCWNRVFIRGSITSEQTQPSANPPWLYIVLCYNNTGIWPHYKQRYSEKRLRHTTLSGFTLR